MISEANAPSTSQVPRAGQVRKQRKKAERLRSRGRRDRRAERTPEKRPVFHKARRDVLGGQRGDGNQRTRRVRRPDPRTIHIGKPDPHLTGVAGLVGFGAYLYELGIDRVLHKLFNHLKIGHRTVYVMGIQIRLLIDLFVVGEFRIFVTHPRAACSRAPPAVARGRAEVFVCRSPEPEARRSISRAVVGRRSKQGKRLPHWIGPA
jgi:hypothetical protein